VSGVTRLRERSPLPAGAINVGVGLVLNGVCTYVFLAIAGHALSADRYSAFAGFWALLFVVAPGIFLPLEQELGRALPEDWLARYEQLKARLSAEGLFEQARKRALPRFPFRVALVTSQAADGARDFLTQASAR